jgi:hypothetical protein
MMERVIETESYAINSQMVNNITPGEKSLISTLYRQNYLNAN